MSNKFYKYFLFINFVSMTIAISGMSYHQKFDLFPWTEPETKYAKWPLSLIDNAFDAQINDPVDNAPVSHSTNIDKTQQPHLQLSSIFECDDLDLSNRNLDDQTIIWLTQALANKLTLKKLDLSGNALSDKSVTNLSTIISNTAFDHLDLGSNDLSANGIYRLGQSLQNSTIHTLSLGNSELTALDAKDLGQCLQGTVVKTLELYWNYMDGVGARDLIQALFKSCVTTLDLSCNGIGDFGINILAPALGKSSLDTLILSHNKISKPVQQSLIKTYPHIKFEFEQEF